MYERKFKEVFIFIVIILYSYICFFFFFVLFFIRQKDTITYGKQLLFYGRRLALIDIYLHDVKIYSLLLVV